MPGLHWRTISFESWLKMRVKKNDAKIVVTKFGGTEEYFGEYAEYVEPSSWELIHHGIMTALNAPKDTLLRDHIAGRFLWRHVAEQTLAAYKTVV